MSWTSPWEARRLRRLKAKLMQANQARSLEKLLRDPVRNMQERMDLVHSWASGYADARKQVASPTEEGSPRQRCY